MKKFLVLFIAILSVFCFSSCEDKEEVIEAVASLKSQGVYPEYLWRK